MSAAEADAVGDLVRLLRRWFTPRDALAVFLLVMIVSLLLSFGPAGIR